MITIAKGITNGAVPMGAVAVQQRDLRDVHGAGPTMRSSSSTATRTRRIRSPAPPASPRSRSTVARACLTRAPSSRRLLGGRGALAQGPAARHRHAQPRPDRRHRARADPGQARRARLRRLPARFEKGVLVRVTGDIIALSPPLIIEKLAHRPAVRPYRRDPARTPIEKTPGLLAETGRCSQEFPGRARKIYLFRSVAAHGNVVDTEKIAVDSLLLTSSGVPSRISRSLPSTYFRPR